MNFSETLFKKYGKNAEILAAGPEAAGDRLATAMSSLKDNVGQLLTPVGSSFQDTFTGIVEQIDGAAKALRNFLKIGEEHLESNIEIIEKQLKIATEYRDFIKQQIDDGSNSGTLRNALAASNKKVLDLTDNLNRLKLKLAEINSEGKETGNTINKTFRETSKLAEEVGKTIRSGIVDTIESAITGAKSLNEVLSGVLRSIGRMYLQAAVNQIPLPGLNAKGNVYAQNGIVPFAKGGIVSQPTIFPFKNGIGLMGEAGEEAVMPLRRNRQGRLGVEASGAGVGNIVVNVDASGSSVEGDSGQAEALGSILGAAIQAEIARQQRPGGLLAAR